ncbi:MAG: hypothetical protein CL916_15015 [Deltaproteobacteria bacterium]|nr:hypothetical protein [Deltaproteobacteria bacterium]
MRNTVFYQLVAENISALSPLILSIISIIVIMYSLPKISKYLADATKDSTWINRYQAIQVSLILSLLFAGLSELTYDLDFTRIVNEHPQQQQLLSQLNLYKKIVSHIFLLLCVIFSFRVVRENQYKKLLSTLFLTLFVYLSLALWEYVPFFWEQIRTIQQSQYHSILAIPVAIIIVMMGHYGMKWIIFPILKKTKTEFDDILFSYLRIPVLASIFLFGLSAATVDYPLPAFWKGFFHSIYLSIAVFIWSRAFFLLSALVLKQLEQKQGKYKIVQPRTLPIFSLLSRMIVTIVSVYCFLLAWDKDPSGWIASAGIIGIAVAYASQDTLASFLAGVAILTDAPYKLNDFLILENGERGKVTHIGFRSTRLLTPDHVEIIIPNSLMSSTQISNMSGGSIKHVRIDCAAGVAYGSDIDEVRRILFDIASRIDHLVKDNEKTNPEVHFVSMGASSLDFVLRIWITNPLYLREVQDQANTLIYKEFTKAGIEIPYAKQDVYLYNMSKDKNT